LDAFTKEEVRKAMMLERFQEEVLHQFVLRSVCVHL
jgi:hypothetical protein